MSTIKLLHTIEKETCLRIKEMFLKKELFLKAFQTLKTIKKNKKKIIIFGNGGSAALASHFSVDITKNAKIRCINFNDADLITCFSNDYGFDKFVAQAINSHYDKGDCVILISVSGESKNVIEAGKFCKLKKIKLITLTGKKFTNSLKKLNKSGINFHINSYGYNIVENIQSQILLIIVDLLIGKITYDTNIGKL
jgi:D-sedoheptulose 7-phosphate isomerase